MISDALAPVLCFYVSIHQAPLWPLQLSAFSVFGLFASCLRRRGANICHCYAAKAPDPQADGYFQHSGHTAVRGRGTICLYWWRESFAQLSNSSQGGQSEPQRETAASLSVRFALVFSPRSKAEIAPELFLGPLSKLFELFSKKTETHWLSHNLLQCLTSSSIH